jgi:hypothetical protein
MLSYVSIGERVFVCSGWGNKTDWYKNIAANPQVTLQLGAKTLVRRARRVVGLAEFEHIVEEMFETGGDSHFESWLESYGIRPEPEDMLEKRERLYLIAFDAAEGESPPAMPADLKWVWGAALVVAIGLWLLFSR